MPISRYAIGLNSKDRQHKSTTSKGDQQKWSVNGMWVKANSKGYEDLAEKVVSDLLRMSSVPIGGYVPYDLVNIKELDTGVTFEGCMSRSFISQSEWFVTLDRLLTRHGVPVDELLDLPFEEKVSQTMRFIEQFTGLNPYPYFGVMLSLDAFVLNEDRHLNNIGFVRDSKGRYRFAPLFDHGLSLLSDVDLYHPEIEVIDNIRSVRAKPFSLGFDKQLKAFDPSTFIRFNKRLLFDYINSLPPETGRIKEVLEYQCNKYNSWLV